MSDMSGETTLAPADLAIPMIAPRQNWLVNALLSNVRCGRLTVVTPSGTQLTHTQTAPGPEGTMVLHRWRTLHRLLTGGCSATIKRVVQRQSATQPSVDRLPLSGCLSSPKPPQAVARKARLYRHPLKGDNGEEMQSKVDARHCRSVGLIVAHVGF